MSVTKAAQLMGVGRPALSNLLNGKASLTPEMASRLEKAFKHPREQLLKMQAEFDAVQATKKRAPEETTAYVPPFLAIKANQIEDWSDQNVPARIRLSVLLRTLVHSTGVGLAKVDFPGNDDAERPGWDGFVEARESTPWIPAGRSGWEFGVNKAVKTKADKDFQKSVKATTAEEREETTFIFVTPRRWAGKDAWIKQAKAKGRWKDVRAYDASDLEQWIEQSLPAQVWFANETNIPADDVRSLDKCWADWANVASPPLAGAVFSTAIDATKRTMLSRLANPSDGPIIVAADSVDEALAYLAQLFSERGGEDLVGYRDRVLVFDKPGVLPRLAQGAAGFIPVVFTRDAERELAPYAHSNPAIVIYPRNAASIQPDVILERANYEAFKLALEEMGKDRDEIDRLEKESGRSLTVLRRRLATVPAVQSPDWAADHEIAASLVPFLFAGAWQSTNGADREGLTQLAGGRSYEELEKQLQRLAQLNDAPVWSIGTYRGIISKVDVLYAIASTITAEDLNRYFSAARMILSEDDPSLDLDEDKRWAASIYGKTRAYSGAFRESVCETLVLLAVHGGFLFKQRLGIDSELQATLVVRDLLPPPLTTRVLQSSDGDLPTFAEAAPDEFLTILERDLKTDRPATLDLMRPVAAGVFGQSPSRTGLLWALEALAWNPLTLPRAVIILARLAKVEINDNWVNKPMHSLQAIFRAWMPQTAAGLEARVELMQKLADRFPEVAWRICVSEFGTHHEVGDYSHKPRWRPDGFGFGDPLPTWEPIIQFRRAMVDLALNWKDHSLATLSDLVERLHGLGDDYQARVWTLIETWATTKASDADKAAMREKIRVAALSRRAAVRAKKSQAHGSVTDKAKATYAALEPSDLLNKHAWLFKDAWVEESADEFEDIDGIDFQQRDERIRKLRVEAIHEVHVQGGLPAVLELAKCGNASFHVGFYASRDVLSEKEVVEILRLALQQVVKGPEPVSSYRSLIAGGLQGGEDGDNRERILKTVAMGLSDEDSATLLMLAPFGKATWTFVDELSETAQSKYWSDVTPVWNRESISENNEAVERLLNAKRPRAAFSCVRFEPEKLDAHVLFRLLSSISAGGNDKPGEYMLDHYRVEQAFKHVDASPTLTLDEKAGLEFVFLEVLARLWDDRPDSYGIPNLERYVESHPEAYVQAIVWAYKRKDGGADPEEFLVPQEHLKSIAERSHKLLEALQRIPGQDEPTEKDKAARLNEWIETVRQASTDLSRSEIADLCIGKLLANAPVSNDGVWPCEHVRDVMEDIQSESMMEGACVEVYNSRGVHASSGGGDQERELAEKYRKWGQALQFSHPYVSAKLLMELAQTYEREAMREDTEDGIRRHVR